VEKELFCPLPCLTAGRVAIGHPICIVNVPHVTVITCHNCWLYRIPMFIAIIAFSGWIVNICQEAYVSLVLPHYSCKSPLVFTRMSPRFSLSVLGLRSLGMFFLCGLTVPQHKIFFLGQVVIQVRGGKEAVHVQFMPKSFYPPCQISHCSMCCCQVLFLPLSLPT